MLSKAHCKLSLALLGTLALASSSFAFELTFPNPTDYWVACGWNNLTWKSDADDPHEIAIMLTNSNKALLNDDLDIGNAVQGSDNAAMVFVPCLPPSSGYSLMFVNASYYDHKKDKVLYQSSQFVIKPKGTAPDPASGQLSIPSRVQPYLETPGIVLPPGKPGDLTNTTAAGHTPEAALPKLDSSSASFGSFHPASHTNGATGQHLVADLVFIVVVTVFTALVVTS